MTINARIAGQNGYYWSNVAIGGGGYITGVYIHPAEQDLIYIRTDVGGFYRWDGVKESWAPLTDHFTYNQWNYYGGEALAIDPNDPDVVYIACGKYVSSWGGDGSLFKSTDRGGTWIKLGLDLPMGGNDVQRWAGERLAVNPFNSQEVYFGSRSNGLYVSTNAGTTWSTISSLSATLTPGIGILGTLFDPYTSGLIYINVYDDGVYKSSDGGSTWAKVIGSPSQVQRMALAPNGDLYVTHLSGVGKCVSGVWSSITPSAGAYNALALNPGNPLEVLVATQQSPYTDVYLSGDGGVSWTKKDPLPNYTVPWRNSKYRHEMWCAAIEYDPHHSGRVWMAGGYSTWQCNDLTANPIVWENYDKGVEETVAFSLLAPASGPILLSGMADVDGFYHDNGVGAYPSQTYGSGSGPDYDNTYSLGYCESVVSRVVRVGGKPWANQAGGATSIDSGLTWQGFSSFPTQTEPLRVAVSATDPDKFVVVNKGASAIVTNDNGGTWVNVTGLPNGYWDVWYWSQPIVADSVNGDRFYYYSGDGKLYRSIDGGFSFDVVNSSLPQNDYSYKLKALRGYEGDIWLGLDWYGLYRSIDGGVTFTKVSSVIRSHLFAFGKAPDNSSTPVLYLYGQVNDIGDGVFKSYDLGANWLAIGSIANPIGNEPNVMEASWQYDDLVFIGTNGRGVFYGALELPPPEPPNGEMLMVYYLVP